MAKLTSLGELVDTAIAAEDAARKVYLGFTHKFINWPEVSDFWQTMADDEGDHVRMLVNIRQRASAQELAAAVDVWLAEKANQLRQLDTHKLINSVNNLDDAYQVAYDLESLEVSGILNFLTSRFLSIAESHAIIAATIDHHLLRLAEFTRAFGNAEQCKHIIPIA